MGTPVEFLNMDEIDKVLHYLLGDGQMTGAYNDVEDITQLLEEKLELAARIGKTLLDKNTELERQLADTGNRLTSAEDKVEQLEHSLSTKNNLLKMLFNSGLSEEGSPNDEHAEECTAEGDYLCSPSGLRSHPVSGIGGNDTPSTQQEPVSLSQLQSALRRLQDEIVALHAERDRCAASVGAGLDEQEAGLGRECARQLIATNAHIRSLIEELAKKSDTCIHQQSELARLLSQRQDWESRAYRLAAENATLVSRLEESQHAQKGLTEELRSLYDKHDECLALFNSTRDKIRLLRRRSRRQHFRVTPTLPPSTSNVVEDQPLVTGAAEVCHRLPSSRMSADLPGHSLMAPSQTGPKASTTTSDLEETVSSSGFVSGSDQAERLSVASSQNPSSVIPFRRIPHANLSVCSSDRVGATNQSSLAEELYRAEMLNGPGSRHIEDEEELHKRHSWFGYYGDDARQQTNHHDNRLFDRLGATNSDNNLALLTNGEAVMLSRSSLATASSLPSQGVLSARQSTVCQPVLPQFSRRLQLVKPFDGSLILRHWQHLATPSFTRALFEAPTPCVQSRAGRGLANSSNTFQPLARPATPKSSATWRNRLHDNDDDGKQPQETVAFGQVPLRPRSQRRLNEGARPSSFGVDLSTQLLNRSLRAQSVERLCLASPPPADRNQPIPDAGIESTCSQTFLTSELTRPIDPTPFSLASLVSAFSPISVVKSGSPAVSDRAQVRGRKPLLPTRGLVDMSQLSGDSPTSAGEEPNALHRAVVTSPTPARLPSALPPPTSVTHVTGTSGLGRSNQSRTSAGMSFPLKEIVEEEGGSPPKTNGLSVATEVLASSDQ